MITPTNVYWGVTGMLDVTYFVAGPEVVVVVVAVGGGRAELLSHGRTRTRAGGERYT